MSKVICPSAKLAPSLASLLLAGHFKAAQNQLGIVVEVMQDAELTPENIEAYRAALKEADQELAVAHAMLKAAA